MFHWENWCLGRNYGLFSIYPFYQVSHDDEEEESKPSGNVLFYPLSIQNLWDDAIRRLYMFNYNM